MRWYTSGLAAHARRRRGHKNSNNLYIHTQYPHVEDAFISYNRELPLNDIRTVVALLSSWIERQRISSTCSRCNRVASMFSCLFEANGEFDPTSCCMPRKGVPSALLEEQALHILHYLRMLEAGVGGIPTRPTSFLHICAEDLR